MFDLVLTMLALLAAGLVVELYAVAHAPLGYQDENGFHLGLPATQGPDVSVLSAPQPRRTSMPAVTLHAAQLEPIGHA